MRNRATTLIVLSALLFSYILTDSPVSTAQTVGSDSAPEATPAELIAPAFGIVAVGDHPTGFFDNIKVAPGSAVELTAAIVNTGTIPVSLRTYKVNALSGINGGFAVGREDDPPVGATAWIEYPSQQLELDPGEHQEITFTVFVPEDAAPGQYISGLIVETAESFDIPGSDILDQVIQYAISVGILVPGELTLTFELGTPEVVDRRLEVPIVNTGNFLVRPSGELTLTNEAGDQVHSSQIQMNSVYAGLTTLVSVSLPEQTPPGEYIVDLALTDEASGAIASIEDAPVTVPEPIDPTGVSATSVTIEPNADPIAFANVALTLSNGGQQIPAANVTLNVMHDGEEVESFPLATNQVLPSGETEITARYIPAEAWEPGTYTFEIVVSAVDPEGGTETVLATVEIPNEITVP